MSLEGFNNTTRKIGNVFVFGVLTENKTDEEKAFEKFVEILKSIPSIAYYRPPLKTQLDDKEPDGLWFNPNLGIVVFEIKLFSEDYLRDKQFNYREKLIDKYGEEQNENPYRQSFGYRQRILDKIKNIIPLPVANIVYFPNLKEKEIDILHSSIKDLIYQHKDETIFKDTDKNIALNKILKKLKVNSFISMNKTDEGYEQKSISEEDYQKIKKLLFPIVQVPKKELDSFNLENVPVLDFYQEGILYRTRPVRKPKKGELYSDKILRGTAGTGKSVVIQAKALFEKLLNPHKKVVLLSYTNSLVNEAKNNIELLIKRENIPVNIDDIDFYTVDSLIKEIYLKINEGNPITKDKKNNNYMDEIIDYVYEYINNGKELPEEFKYDVILIDESQDLTKKHIEIIHSLKKDIYLTIWGVDETQRIYGSDKENDSRNWKWHEVKVNAKGNTMILKRTYRNPGSIVRFARKFLSLDKVMVDRLKELNLADNEIEIMREDKQSIELIETKEDYLDFILKKTVKELLSQGYEFKDIMILLPSKGFITNTGKYLINTFGEENINYFSANSSKREKEAIKDKLNILSYHSAKGLEKPVVIVSSINYYPYINSKENRLVEEIRTERRLLYVAMTRPLEKLILIYHNQLDETRKKHIEKKLKSVNGLSFGEEIKNLMGL